MNQLGLLSDWEEIGTVGVDSGQIVIADPCYVLSKDEYKKLITDYQQQPHEFKHGVINSGWGGDGTFPVFVKKDDDGRIIEMKVVFKR